MNSTPQEIFDKKLEQAVFIHKLLIGSAVFIGSAAVLLYYTDVRPAGGRETEAFLLKCRISLLVCSSLLGAVSHWITIKKMVTKSLDEIFNTSINLWSCCMLVCLLGGGLYGLSGRLWDMLLFCLVTTLLLLLSTPSRAKWEAFIESAAPIDSVFSAEGEDVWYHNPVTLGSRLALSIVVLVIYAVLIPFLMDYNNGLLLKMVSGPGVALLVAAFVFESGIVINKNSGFIYKRLKIFRWERTKKIPLSDFDRLVFEFIIIKNSTHYHAVLRGKDSFFLVYRSTYEDKTRMQLEGLAEYLDLPYDRDMEAVSPHTETTHRQAIMAGVVLITAMLGFGLFFLVLAFS